MAHAASGPVIVAPGAFPPVIVANGPPSLVDVCA